MFSSSAVVDRTRALVLPFLPPGQWARPVLNGEGSKDAIQARCEQIRALLADSSTSEFDKTKLQEQLAKSSSGVAVIKVGRAVRSRLVRRRATKMMRSTPCVLPGGGVTLLKALLAPATNTPGPTGPPSNPDAKIIATNNFDQDLGVNIIRRAVLGDCWYTLGPVRQCGPVCDGL